MRISDYAKEPKFLQTVENFEAWLEEAIGDEIENVPDFYQWALFTSYCDQDVRRLGIILIEYVGEILRKNKTNICSENAEKPTDK